MKKVFGILLLLLVFPTFVNADSFCIEEKNLLQMPPKVENLIIQAEEGEWKGCKFEGKYADLDGNGHKSYLIVTTADACGWGNAKGPIWVLLSKNDDFKSLLSESGYKLTITKSKKNGLYSLDIMAATAGWHEKNHFEFNGEKYVKINKPKKK